MEKIGITTTIPVEIIFAANKIPVDLNNIFISHSAPEQLINQAEQNGFPRTTCCWIKGLYSTAINEGINKIVAVMEGDCSNTHSLSEIWNDKGIEIIPFSYPYNKDYKILKNNIEKLMSYFHVDFHKVGKTKKKIDKIRKKLKIIDCLTYEENLVTGFENHIFLVSASDFQSNIYLFEKKIDDFLQQIKNRKPFNESVRLGLIGVPPIITNLYEEIERFGARIVFNEVQRQFAMIDEYSDIVEQYLAYTYPYSVFDRIKDVEKEIELRNIDGIIHYVQAFCHRNIQDSIFKKYLKVPVLTLEGDRPGDLDERNRIRIESFIDMILAKKGG